MKNIILLIMVSGALFFGIPQSYANTAYPYKCDAQHTGHMVCKAPPHEHLLHFGIKADTASDVDAYCDNFVPDKGKVLHIVLHTTHSGTWINCGSGSTFKGHKYHIVCRNSDVIEKHVDVNEIECLSSSKKHGSGNLKLSQG